MKHSEMMGDGYLFESARVRALENSLIGKERIERLLESGSLDRCIALLSEFGVELVRDAESGAFQREDTLGARLRSAYDELLRYAPEAEFLKLWLYPYDCNNVKAAIKCRKRGVDCRELLFDFGEISGDEVIRIVEQNRFEELPEAFAEAAKEASEGFYKTANPQFVDLILDRACYRAMLEAAERSGSDFAVRLVKMKIDLINLTICVRLLRMNSGEAGKGMLRSALLEGGTLSQSYLSDLYDAGESAFWEKLSFSEYRSFAQRVCGAEATLTEVETAADNAFMDVLTEAKLIPYGDAPLIGYLLASEYEVRNLRILLAGFGIGLPSHTVRERIRNSYV